MKVSYERVYYPPLNSKFEVHNKLNLDVVCLRLYPGITPNMVRNVLAPPTAGAVLHTFGSGNAPSNPLLLAEIKAAADRGVVIINVTQCLHGSVAPHYATGTALIRANVIPGYDLTVEAALAKLTVVLGHSTTDVARELMKVSCRGEMTDNKSQNDFSFQNNEFILSVAKAMNVGGVSDRIYIAEALAPTLFLSAVNNGDISKLENLLDQGIDVNITDYNKRSALHIGIYIYKLLP